MAKAHGKRGWWERSLVGVVALGLVVGAGLAYFDAVPFRAMRHGGESHGDSGEGGPSDLAGPGGGGSAGAAGTGSLAGAAGPGADSLTGAAGSVPGSVLTPGPGSTGGADLNSLLGAGLPGSGGAQGTGEPQQAAGEGSPDAAAAPGAGPESPQAAAGGPAVPQGASAPSQRADVPVASITSMEWPVSGGVLRPFGWYRHPVLGDWRHSSAVVLQPEVGGSPVTAALAGRVTEVVNAGGVWRVTIRHAGGWETEYEGLASVDIASYEVVATGQVIGYAPDPPLGVAFALYRDGVAVDPTEILGEPSATVQAP